MNRFVPAHSLPDSKHLKKFIDELCNIDRLLVITGAGISTESGIPDYRSKNVGLYERSTHRPMTHQEFVKSPKARQRYWSRNFLAWPIFYKAECNITHRTIAKWERSERFKWLITQNVDGLHLQAGSSLITELHGSGHHVKCLNCNHVIHRLEMQNRLLEMNPLWGKDVTLGELRPDGDVHIKEGAEQSFNVPDCSSCGGILKTDVVFFGDSVPRKLVDLCYENLEESEGVLVLGSSLSVMSAYRFVYHAHLQKKPILIVNIGQTRADAIATVKLDARVSDVITRI